MGYNVLGGFVIVIAAVFVLGSFFMSIEEQVCEQVLNVADCKYTKDGWIPNE